MNKELFVNIRTGASWPLSVIEARQLWPMSRIHPRAIKEQRVISNETRNNVWIRDRGRCRYCGRPADWCAILRWSVNRERMAHFDHVVPVNQFGRGTPDNIVLACYDCNLGKGCRTPEQAGMTLLSLNEIDEIVEADDALAQE